MGLTPAVKIWPCRPTQCAEARICGRFSKMRILAANCRLRSMWNRGAGLEICEGFMRNLPPQQVLHYWGQHRRKDWKRTLWKLKLKPNTCFCEILQTLSFSNLIFQIYVSNFEKACLHFFFESPPTWEELGKCIWRLFNFCHHLSYQPYKGYFYIH